MNTIFLRLAGLKIAKEFSDIRGKKFLQKQQKLQKIFEKFFQNIADELIKALENRANLAGVQIVEKSEWWDDVLGFFENDPIFVGNLEKILQEIYNLGIDEEFRERNAEVGGSFDINNIYSKNYSENRAGELMRGVAETTRKEVRSIFAEGWQNSNSLKEISEKIQEKFAGFASWRADLIAMQETSFAYEVGRADQFAKLSKDTGITGWKRSQSQGDDTVRATHRQNELDGWISNDEEFSGTLTMHAPHGFRCRCVVVRRLLEPQIDEKLGVYYRNVDLPNIWDAIAGDLTKIAKNIQSSAPWLPPLNSIYWSDFGDPNIMGWFIPKYNSIILNPKSLEVFWYMEMKETLEHEYWHAIIHFFKKNPDETILNRKASELQQEIFENGWKILQETDEAIKKAFEYPFSIIETKKYWDHLLSEEKALEVAKEEVFAEAMRYYQNWETWFFPDYYKNTMNFIFDNRTEISLKKSAWPKNLKRFELSGEDFDWWWEQHKKSMNRMQK